MNAITMKTFSGVCKPLSLAVAVATLAACDSGSSSRENQAAAPTTAVGTIDGFGSVIVNGVHYNTDNADFRINELAGSQSELEVGQQVVVVGNNDGAEGVAQSISYQQSIEGPVSEKVSDSELLVLGQRVLVDEMTVFKEIDMAAVSAGVWLEISGTRDAEGALRASFVELEQAGEEVELVGEISAHDSAAMTFKISELTVNYHAAQIDVDGSEVADGLLVEVEGSLDGEGVLQANEVESEELELSDGDELELEGRIVGLDLEAGSFSINGVTVSFADDTGFEDGSRSDLADNIAVEVEGVIDNDGVLQADEIEFDDDFEGEIESLVTAVNLEASTLTLLGVELLVDADTRVDDDRDDEHYFSLDTISEGDYIEAIVAVTEQGWRAVKLERKESQANDAGVAVEISGAVELGEGNVVRLLGQSFDLSLLLSPQLSIAYADIIAGDVLELNGRLVGGELQIDTVSVED